MLKIVTEKLQSHQPVPQDDEGDPAAVLLLLTEEPEPKLVFTVRSSKMRKHGGEVAFPGGKYELEDDNLWTTALRETEEEIGLGRARVRHLGTLDERISRYGSKVTPFVGSIAPEIEFKPDPVEVDDVFQVPLAHFMDLESNFYTFTREFRGRDVHVACFDYNGFTIFGLTAMMAVNLIDVVRGTSTRWGQPRPKRN